MKRRRTYVIGVYERTRIFVDDFAELGVVQDRLLPLGGVR